MLDFMFISSLHLREKETRTNIIKLIGESVEGPRLTQVKQWRWPKPGVTLILPANFIGSIAKDQSLSLVIDFIVSLY
jgi:hypothetical protein